MKVEKCYKVLGENIRNQRLSINMTQTDLAKKIKRSRTSVVNVEQGRQRVLLHDIITFAKALKTKNQTIARNVF